MAWDIFYDGGTSLPSWVPAAGEIATYTGGGSVLTNNWRAIHDPAPVGYDPFHSRKVTDYSAFFLHPTWRTHGGMVIWGGGHSATNYNGVTMLTFGASTMYFECVATPTNWTAGDDVGDISAEVNAYGEKISSNPLRLVGPHSYGSGDVISGKFVQVASAAWGYANFGSGQVAHELDLSDPAAAASARAWVRRTSSTGSWAWQNAPYISRYVSAQNRVHFMARGGGGPYSPQWFDLSNNTWVTGTGTGFSFPEGDTNGGDPQTGALIYVPERDLLLGMWRASGNLKIEYMNVAAGVSQPTVGGTASLSSTLAVPVNWQAACWCSRSSRLLVFGVTSNTDKVYEITIPSTLSNTWTVDSHTLTGGATISPAALSVWGKSMEYHDTIRAVVFMQSGIVDTGNDTVRVYRPRNT